MLATALISHLVLWEVKVAGGASLPLDDNSHWSVLSAQLVRASVQHAACACGMHDDSDWSVPSAQLVRAYVQHAP